MSLALDNFPSSIVFDEIAAGMQNADFVAHAILELDEIFAIELENVDRGKMIWVIDFKKTGTITCGDEGLDPKLAGVTMALSDQNWGELARGTSSAPKLYLLNKLKLKGPLAKARKFNKVLHELKEKTDGKTA